MLASPSFTVLQLTQVPLLTNGVLAAKFGFAKTMAAYTANMDLMTNTAGQMADWYKQNTLRPTQMVGLRPTTPVPPDMWDIMSRSFSPAAKAGLKELVDRGKITSTFMQELMETMVQPNAQGWVSTGWNNTLNWARAAPQFVEALNRVMTAKMVFDLAGNANPDTVEYAETVIDKTHFDYANENYPGFFNMPGARPILMFKKYVMGVYQLLSTALWHTVSGGPTGSNAARIEAAKTFGYIIGAHALAGGVATAVWEPIKWLAAGAMMAIPDWGDDEGDEFALWVRNAIAEFTGGGLLQDMMMGGVPAAAGLSISQRISLSDMLFREHTAETYKEGYQRYMVQLLGPLYGVGESAMGGIDKIQQGELLKGLGLMLPKGLRDLSKAWDLAERGPTTGSGMSVQMEEPLGLGDLAWQAGGFRSFDEAMAQQRRFDTEGAEQRPKTQRKLLLRRLVNAMDDAGAYEEVFSDIWAFNDEYPHEAITSETMIKAMRERNRLEMDQINGANVEPDARGYVQDVVRY
jgi:hypothetical protein